MYRDAMDYIRTRSFLYTTVTGCQCGLNIFVRLQNAVEIHPRLGVVTRNAIV
jgi:hypothetical protein